LNAEVYAPPYLFKGARPVITGVPATVGYNQTVTVQTPDAARIASVVLIAPSEVTHAFNMGQRFVPLSFTVGTGALSVTMPPNGNAAPPGYYMLFIVDANGIPSVARFVQL